MTVGLPKALLYYRCGVLWEVFFASLGCRVVVSGDTCRETLGQGLRHSVDESCLPIKAFMGHVQALMGRCRYILVPRFARLGPGDEYCVRFWGLPDLVRNTFPQARLLTYNVISGRPGAEALAFVGLGAALGKSPAQALWAYRAGARAQAEHDRQAEMGQQARLALPGPKILIAGQPYLSHDPYLGGAVARLIEAQGGVPVFSDRCDRRRCREASQGLSRELYWVMNKEAAGAIFLCRGRVDGVILLTAFPCGTDSLVNELILRREKAAPLIQILLDEHQAQAGLETRVESFMDILRQRRAEYA